MTWHACAFDTFRPILIDHCADLPGAVARNCDFDDMGARIRRWYRGPTRLVFLPLPPLQPLLPLPNLIGQRRLA
jgi:hypothetical protein